MQTAGKEKKIASRAGRPELARADMIDKGTRARILAEVDAALKRRPASEAKLSGAFHALAQKSAALRNGAADAADVLVRRRSFDRDLYSASVRALAEVADRRAPALLVAALASDEAGGSATLAASSVTSHPALAPSLGRIAAGRQSYLAFLAETARVVRGEANGTYLAQLSPMIKEAHRISACVDVFVALARGPAVPRAIAPALSILRGAERHLGRWLVMAEIATRAGDPEALDEARARATSGPSSSRGAWALVAWALEDALARDRPGAPRPACPDARPTVELIARLSDRPSANRDMTFLFRMAESGAACARPMLDAMVKGGNDARGGGLLDELAVRAALYLVRDHGRGDLVEALAECASPRRGKSGKREELRGMAAAALFDLGQRDRAVDLADDLVASRLLGNVAWGALVRAGGDAPILTEAHVRWIQWGWPE